MHFILIFCAFRIWSCHLHPPATSQTSFLLSVCRRQPRQYRNHSNHYASSTCYSAHMLDLRWLALLLSSAINFNQILCTQLYSSLKPFKVLLLLRKPLFCYPPAWLCRLLYFISPSFSLSPF